MVTIVIDAFITIFVHQNRYESADVDTKFQVFVEFNTTSFFSKNVFLRPKVIPRNPSAYLSMTMVMVPRRPNHLVAHRPTPQRNMVAKLPKRRLAFAL